MGMSDNYYDEMEKCSFGLDFGTSYSLFALKREDSLPEAIKPIASDYRNGIPSLFWRRPENRFQNLPEEMLCGEVLSRDALFIDPEGVVSSVKMRLLEKSINVHGVDYPPAEIALKIVKKIKELTNEELVLQGMSELPREIVVGVPATFNSNQRKIIRQILLDADFEATLIAEPVAAALYYASIRKKQFKKVMVMDFGAGTFDISVLSENKDITLLDPYPYTVLAQGGTEIAGDLFDQCMAELIIEKIRAENPEFPINSFIDKKKQDYLKLLSISRASKERISQYGDSEPMAIMITGSERRYVEVYVTLKEYEEKIAPLILENINKTITILKNSGLYGDPELELLLVGGSSYLPIIRKMIEGHFSAWLHSDRILQRAPELAIAYGCALYDEMPRVAPKVSYGFAVDTYYRDEYVLSVTVPSMVELPYNMIGTFKTRYEDQDGIIFNIYEVPDVVAEEHIEVSKGKYSGYRIKHDFGKKVPKGTPIELTTHIDSNGILTFTVYDYGISENGVTVIELNIGNEGIHDEL